MRPPDSVPASEGCGCSTEAERTSPPHPPALSLLFLLFLLGQLLQGEEGVLPVQVTDGPLGASVALTLLSLLRPQAPPFPSSTLECLGVADTWIVVQASLRRWPPSLCWWCLLPGFLGEGCWVPAGGTKGFRGP